MRCVCGILPGMFGSDVFSIVLTITGRSEMGLYNVLMFTSLLDIGIGMFANLHACEMMLSSTMLYMLVRYASPIGPMCLMCLMLTLSYPVDCCFCFVLLPLGLVLW